MKLKKFSLNHIVLVYIPAVIIFLGFIFSQAQFVNLPEYLFTKSILYYLVFASIFFEIFFPLLYIYIFVKVMYGLICNLLKNSIHSFQKIKASLQNTIKKRIPTTKKLLLFLATVQFATFSIVVMVNQIGDVNPDRVVNMSERLMQWDYTVFGSYVPFALQDLASNEVIDYLLVGAYLFLAVFLSLVLIFLIITKPMRYLRLYLFSFFLAAFLATPFWYLFPAVTPNEMYRENKLEVTESGPIRDYAKMQSAKTSDRVTTLLAGLSQNASRPEEGHYHVPTFPSMHIAWSVVVVFFAFQIWLPFGSVSFLWGILNIFGSMYTLQHYAVDVLLGLFIGTCAIALSYALIRVEERGGFTKPPSIGVENIQNDIKSFSRWFREIIRLLK